jgi:ABC-type multidrug transport system fused ATPase/permease subunit
VADPKMTRPVAFPALILQTFAAYWSVLSSRERAAAAVVVALAASCLVLEMIGVGLVVPLLVILMNPTWIKGQDWIGRWTDDLSSTQAVALAMMAVIVAFFCKALLTLVHARYQARFVFQVEARLSVGLLENYMSRPWVFHLQRNSAELITNVKAEMSTFAFALLAFMQLISDAIVVLGLVALLVMLDPLASLAIAGLMFICASAIQLALRRRVDRWGVLRQKLEIDRFKQLTEALSLLRELRVAGRVMEFVRRYRESTAASALIVERNIFAGAVPKTALEFVSVVALSLVVFVAIATDHPLDKLVPTLGVFAAAAGRLMPAVSRCLQSTQLVRMSLPTIKKISFECAQTAETVSRFSSGASIPQRGDLVFDHVSFRYPDARDDALANLSLTIPFGSVVGLIGASGSGKSTATDLMLGLLAPRSGFVRVGGVDIANNMAEWRQRVGYVPQSIVLVDDTLRRNVALGVPDREIDDAAVRRALDAASLTDFLDRLPSGLDSMLGERGARMSGGQRQRVGIARALYHNPSFLILDEATSALDHETEESVMTSVFRMRGSRTIVLVAHRLSTVTRCDWLYRLAGGRVVAQGQYHEVVAERLDANGLGPS